MKEKIQPSDIQRFISVNRLKKKELAEYLNVSAAFITQIVQGLTGLPDDKLEQIKENKVWDTSMLHKVDDIDLSELDSPYYKLIKRLVEEGVFVPLPLVEQKDEEIKRLEQERIKLYKEIGRLEERLEQSKKTGAQEDDNVICAAVV